MEIIDKALTENKARKIDKLANRGLQHPDVPFLRIIDVDSPFFFGVGRDMTAEERVNAEKYGRHDNPPMSVLGVTKEGLAAVNGKEMAQMFASSPKVLSALEDLLVIAVDLINASHDRGESEYPAGNILEIINAQAAISESRQNDARRTPKP